MNITVVSYGDSIDFGIIACERSVPHVADIALGFGAAVADLSKLALDERSGTSVQVDCVGSDRFSARRESSVRIAAAAKPRRRSGWECAIVIPENTFLDSSGDRWAAPLEIPQETWRLWSRRERFKKGRGACLALRSPRLPLAAMRAIGSEETAAPEMRAAGGGSKAGHRWAPVHRDRRIAGRGRLAEAS